MTCASASRVDHAADATQKRPKHVPWTKEEDARLQRMQEKYGNKWSTVAGFLPGRTGQQCAQRWRHRVNPNIRRDKWTKEEDDKVLTSNAANERFFFFAEILQRSSLFDRDQLSLSSRASASPKGQKTSKSFESMRPRHLDKRERFVTLFFVLRFCSFLCRRRLFA